MYHMEKKVYVIFKSSKGSKDLCYVTESVDRASYFVDEARKMFSDSPIKVNFRVVEMSADFYYALLPKPLNL